MIFKKVALEFTQFDEETLNEISDIVRKKCQENVGPLADVRNRAPDQQQLQGRNVSVRAKRREQDFVMRDLITALGTCHNVTPTYEKEGDMSTRAFQASSPDEVALVKFADEMGMQLIERDQSKMVI